jgi:type I restriction enzyme S subunit
MQCLGFGLGRVGIARTTVAFNQQINASTFSEDVRPEFGLYYLMLMGDWVRREATTTLTPLLNKTRFLTMPFVVPPLEEQDAVVEAVKAGLSAIAELREERDRVLAETVALASSWLAGALGGRMVPRNRGNGRLTVHGAKS